jgi:hypothetical protein
MNLSGIYTAFQQNQPICFLRIGPMLCVAIILLARAIA